LYYWPNDDLNVRSKLVAR